MPEWNRQPAMDGVERAEAISSLMEHVEEFLQLERDARPDEVLYHRLLSIVHHICESILECEQASLSRSEIVALLEPVRRVHSRSPFVDRLQRWPRGYPGDFETVEYLLRGTNLASERIARMCEAYALSRSIAQQHRNKVHHQARRLLRTMRSAPLQTRIASIACGSCADLRLILEQLPPLVGELWLNDLDSDALAFSEEQLAPIADRCRFRNADAISFARRLDRGGFDLVLAGGLFDYLDPRSATLLIQLAYRALAPGGTFYFTNIAAGNPYRPLIEYFGDWTLIERTEAEILTYCERAGISPSNVTMSREETGLALLIEVTRLD